MDKNECTIQMLDFYFSKYDFSLIREQENSEYSTSFKIEQAVSSEDKSKVKITIDTTVKNKIDSLLLNLQTIGIFKIEAADIDSSTYYQLVKQNTVAIMFPFIRSQISLLTTQPGMVPIMIPPLNIAALASEGNEID